MAKKIGVIISVFKLIPLPGGPEAQGRKCPAYLSPTLSSLCIRGTPRTRELGRGAP